MTGEQRLQIAMNLHAISCDVARAFAGSFQGGEADVERELRRRLEIAKQA